MRCTSRGTDATLAIDSVTAGPREKLSTKCPSIMSTWNQSAPAFSARFISSPILEKSHANTDGAIMIGFRFIWFFFRMSLTVYVRFLRLRSNRPMLAPYSCRQRPMRTASLATTMSVAKEQRSASIIPTRGRKRRTTPRKARAR
jgi:hypothetical protein